MPFPFPHTESIHMLTSPITPRLPCRQASSFFGEHRQADPQARTRSGKGGIERERRKAVLAPEKWGCDPLAWQALAHAAHAPTPHIMM